MAGGRSGDLHLGLRGDAPVVGAVLDHLPAVFARRDFDHAHAVGHHALEHIVIGFGFAFFPVAPDDLAVGVFVVDGQKQLVAVSEDLHPVGIVPESDGLAVAGAAGVMIELDTVTRQADRPSAPDCQPRNRLER